MVLAVLLVGGFFLTRGGDDESAQTATRPTADTTASGSAPPTTGAATTPTTGTTATTEARPGGPCKPENLSAAVVTSAVRANGSVRVVALTNSGRRSCTLEGYPGLQLTGLEGEALTAQVTQGGGAVPAGLGVQTVTVQPEARASFVMAWDRGGSCLSVQSLGILLPGEATPGDARLPPEHLRERHRLRLAVPARRHRRIAGPPNGAGALLRGGSSVDPDRVGRVR